MLLALLITLIFLGLLSGFPVAFVLSGVSLLIAGLGHMLGLFDVSFLSALPNRMFGIMTNELLIAVPLFVFMGSVLERSKIAEDLLEQMSCLFGQLKSGIGLSVMLVGGLLAASTGIVGATVVTMGLISLPSMLKNGYHPRLATGSICAAGTLGQIIPPSIVLILLGDQMSNAYQNVQMKQGNLNADPVSIADLFMGALIPGLILIALYMIWIAIASTRQHTKAISKNSSLNLRSFLRTLMPPLVLIAVVLGSILSGVATATESASVGGIGALLLALCRKELSFSMLRHVVRTTAYTSSMVFTILIGATIFTLVFRGLGGDDLVHQFLSHLPGGLFTVMLITMLTLFMLGFFLDFIEIIFVVVPIIAPILLSMGADPIWLAIMIAINLQTSFLTPPFGFALFYLRGVAPKTLATSDIYKGVIPFVIIQLLVLVWLAFMPSLATWLPKTLYGTSTETVVNSIGSFDEEYYDVDF